MDPDIWRQLKSLTPSRLIKALVADGWNEDINRGATRAFLKDGARVVIHYHPKRTYRPKLLRKLLGDIGWGESDLARLKMIKRKRAC